MLRIDSEMRSRSGVSSVTSFTVFAKIITPTRSPCTQMSQRLRSDVCHRGDVIAHTAADIEKKEDINRIQCRARRIAESEPRPSSNNSKSARTEIADELFILQ